MTNNEMVQNFHLVFNRPARVRPAMIPLPNRLLRIGLLAEEFSELVAALGKSDLVGSADAIGDLLYVTYGTAVEMGINADAVVAEIHRSNMTKLARDGKPILRADGKVLKGEDYEPPDIARVLNGRSDAA